MNEVIYNKAVEVFGNEEDAQAWLKSKVPSLGHETPEERSLSLSGIVDVIEVLERIKWGVYN